MPTCATDATFTMRAGALASSIGHNEPGQQVVRRDGSGRRSSQVPSALTCPLRNIPPTLFTSTWRRAYRSRNSSASRRMSRWSGQIGQQEINTRIAGLLPDLIDRGPAPLRASAHDDHRRRPAGRFHAPSRDRFRPSLRSPGRCSGPWSGIMIQGAACPPGPHSCRISIRGEENRAGSPAGRRTGTDPGGAACWVLPLGVIGMECGRSR